MRAGDDRGDPGAAEGVQAAAGESDDAEVSGGILRKEAVQSVSVVSAGGEVQVCDEDERGPAGLVYGAVAHGGLRAGQHQHQQARNHEGPALA